MIVRIPLRSLIGAITLAWFAGFAVGLLSPYRGSDMVSSALSSRRGLLRRPKVCFTLPNPGRCDPPPPPPPPYPGTIEIIPFPPYTVDTTTPFDFKVCHPDFPTNFEVTPEWTFSAGSLASTDQGHNCGFGDSMLYQAPSFAGMVTVDLEIPFPDSSVAKASVEIEVIIF